MVELLTRVIDSQGALLGPGERFIAAAKVSKKTGASPYILIFGVFGRLIAQNTQVNPPGVVMANDMIWAASNTRLFIWVTDGLTGSRPKRLIAALPLGSEALDPQVGARAPGAGFGKTYLTVMIRGARYVVEARTSAAQDLAGAISAVLPPPPGAAPTWPPLHPFSDGSAITAVGSSTNRNIVVGLALGALVVVGLVGVALSGTDRQPARRTVHGTVAPGVPSPTTAQPTPETFRAPDNSFTVAFPGPPVVTTLPSPSPQFDRVHHYEFATSSASYVVEVSDLTAGSAVPSDDMLLATQDRAVARLAGAVSHAGSSILNGHPTRRFLVLRSSDGSEGPGEVIATDHAVISVTAFCLPDDGAKAVPFLESFAIPA